jgi:metallo-beta-lactamase class B
VTAIPCRVARAACGLGLLMLAGRASAATPDGGAPTAVRGSPDKAPIQVLGALNAAGAVQIVAFDDKLLIHQSQDANGIPANGLIFRTERGLILIDTGWTETQTEAILIWGEQKLGRRWMGAVITHDHADRAGGIGALLRRKIPVAALDLTVAKLAQRGVHGVATLFTAKTGTFDDERGFQAFYPGPGHAPDNIVIAFRADKVVFGGCLIKSTKAEDLGFTGDADRVAWRAAVRRVEEKYPGMLVVPGHGRTDDRESAYARTVRLLNAGQAH